MSIFVLMPQACVEEAKVPRVVWLWLMVCLVALSASVPSVGAQAPAVSSAPSAPAAVTPRQRLPLVSLPIDPVAVLQKANTAMGSPNLTALREDYAGKFYPQPGNATSFLNTSGNARYSAPDKADISDTVGDGTLRTVYINGRQYTLGNSGQVHCLENMPYAWPVPFGIEAARLMSEGTGTLPPAATAYYIISYDQNRGPGDVRHWRLWIDPVSFRVVRYQQTDRTAGGLLKRDVVGLYFDFNSPNTITPLAAGCPA